MLRGSNRFARTGFSSRRLREAMKTRLRLIAYTTSFALCFLNGWAGDSRPTSEFTTTDPAKVKIIEDSSREKHPEIDHFKHLCPGFGGYAVIHEGGDARSWINLKFDGKITDLAGDTLSACPGQFPAKANNVVEWRGLRKDRSFVPYAIIYRMMSSSGDDKPTRIETLIIIKLDGKNSRVAGHVAGVEGNEKAEELADRLCR